MDKPKTLEELQAENLALIEANKTLTGERDSLKTELDATKKALGESRELNGKLYLRLSSDDDSVKEEEQPKKLVLEEEIANYLNPPSEK